MHNIQYKRKFKSLKSLYRFWSGYGLTKYAPYNMSVYIKTYDKRFIPIFINQEVYINLLYLDIITSRNSVPWKEPC